MWIIERRCEALFSTNDKWAAEKSLIDDRGSSSRSSWSVSRKRSITLFFSPSRRHCSCCAAATGGSRERRAGSTLDFSRICFIYNILLHTQVLDATRHDFWAQNITEMTLWSLYRKGKRKGKYEGRWKREKGWWKRDARGKEGGLSRPSQNPRSAIGCSCCWWWKNYRYSSSPYRSAVRTASTRRCEAQWKTSTRHLFI